MTAELAEELLEAVPDEETADDGAKDCDSEGHVYNLPPSAVAYSP